MLLGRGGASELPAYQDLGKQPTCFSSFFLFLFWLEALELQLSLFLKLVCYSLFFKIHLFPLFLFKAYSLKVSTSTLARPLSWGQLGTSGPSPGLAGPLDFWLRSESDSSKQSSVGIEG